VYSIKNKQRARQIKNEAKKQSIKGPEEDRPMPTTSAAAFDFEQILLYPLVIVLPFITKGG